MFFKRKKEPAGKPRTIAINHDDYHANCIGKTETGTQFFLTPLFIPASQSNEGSEYLALFKFDSKGSLVESEILNLGSRKELDKSKAKQKYSQLLNSLGSVEYCRIVVQPFSVQKDGVDFGLVLREPEDADDVWAVELLPGNFMAFFEPWDSGEYDT